MTRFRFTLRELLCAVAALAAYLAMARDFCLGSIEFYEKHKPMGWLLVAECYALLWSPIFASLWVMSKLARDRNPNVSASISAEAPETPDN